VGKRGRRQQRSGAGISDSVAPEHDYSDAEGNILTLRGSLTVGSRQQYARTLNATGGRAAGTQEDAWQRAAELLFERLAVRWVIAGVPTSGQRELLARFRLASSEERRWIRDVLREHCSEHFPDVQAP